MYRFKKYINQIKWTLPFIAFIFGYFSLQYFIADPQIQTPNFIGKDILKAVKISSHYKLNLRIIAEKEIPDATPGTIVSQNPLPDSPIKKDQSIFIVIAKLPNPIKTPVCIGKRQKEIEQMCKEQNIKHRFYFLPSNYPTGQCFIQMPYAEQNLEEKKVSCYISTGNQNQYVFPDFIGQNIDVVIDFLQKHTINFDIYHKNQKIHPPYTKNYTISYQKPLAGTLIIPHNKLYVQLQVN